MRFKVIFGVHERIVEKDVKNLNELINMTATDLEGIPCFLFDDLFVNAKDLTAIMVCDSDRMPSEAPKIVCERCGKVIEAWETDAFRGRLKGSGGRIEVLPGESVNEAIVRGTVIWCNECVESTDAEAYNFDKKAVKSIKYLKQLGRIESTDSAKLTLP